MEVVRIVHDFGGNYSYLVLGDLRDRIVSCVKEEREPKIRFLNLWIA